MVGGSRTFATIYWCNGTAETMIESIPSPEDLLEKFARQRILVVGDVMLDWFIWGSVSRISPEAPVPIVEVQRESRFPGGGANVARNLTPFGGPIKLAGIFGSDPNGRLLRQTLNENGIGIDLCLEVEDFPTITKTRVVARHQQVVRIDREQCHHRLDDDLSSRFLDSLTRTLPDIDGLIIEDYGKGLITRDLVAHLLTAAADFQNLKITVDPKPGNPIPWKGVTTVKPNRSEAFEAAEIEDLHREQLLSPMDDAPLLKAGNALLKKWECQHVLLTLGEQGMLLFSQTTDPVLVPARAREVFDVSGAGDTAIAVYTLGLCAGLDATSAAETANLASSIVVGKLGTTPIEKEELQQALEAENPHPK